MARETFGIIGKERSGRYRARYTDPRPDHLERHAAASTFATKSAARAWLVRQQAEIAAGTWVPPDVAAKRKAAAEREAARKEVTLGEYAETWMRTRTNSRGDHLRAKTLATYKAFLRPAGTPTTRDHAGTGGPLASLIGMPVGDITSEAVREWHSEQLDTGHLTQTARAYDLMKTILSTAVEDGIIASNPCRIRGGSTTTTGKRVIPPTPEEFGKIARAIDPRYRTLIMIGAVGGLRSGEIRELRVKDVSIERDAAGDIDIVRLNVRRQVIYTQETGYQATEPKTEAGERVVAVRGNDAREIAAQLDGKAPEDLLITNPGGTSWLPQSTFWRHWHKAVTAAGRPDLPLHALRHYAGTRYSQAGATVKETMARLGHSTQNAAMRYQHSGDRDDELALRLSRLGKA